jgi:hypothetical protein
MVQIAVDPEVIDLIRREGKDFRVSTDCSGPVLMPVEMKPQKDSDLKIRIGDHTLFISRVQARYIDRITLDMLYHPDRRLSCGLYDEL